MCGSSVSSTTERLGVGLALAVGVVVRVAPIAGATNVVGDGGLILSMVDDLRASGLALPATTTYNGLEIPFMYPPLGLLAAAAMGEALGVSTIDLLRWLPLAFSVGCLAAFAWVAWRALPPLASVGATLAYALMPSAYGWLVAGGGLTRALGLLLALLAAGLVANRAGDPLRRTAILAGALLGLSALTHPQAAIFGVLACAVLSWRRPIGTWLLRLVIAVTSALILMLPWIVWVLGTQGFDSLLSSGHRLDPLVGVIRMLNLRFSAAPFMDVVGVAGVVGLLVSVARREFRLPILLVATYLAGSGGGEFLAAVPWALLAGSGVASLVGVGRAAMAGAHPGTARRLVIAMGSLALFLALIGSFGSNADRSSKLHPLAADQIAAMQWLAEHTPESSSVIVPTDEVWGYDEMSEWLPALARRHSIGTVQGSEWLGKAGFEAQLDSHHAILRCVGSTAGCYRSIDPDAVVFVPKGQLAGPFSPGDCCPALRESLAGNGYRIIYDGPGATIAQPTD
jgi:hypothetical protein